MAGKTVGELQIDLQMKGDSLNASMKNVQKNVSKQGAVTGNALGNALVVAAGNVIASGVSTMVSGIMSRLDNAFARVDTLASYKTTMTNLGYAIEDVEKARKELEAGVQGLPTTLPAIVSMQQRFAALSGNIEESTKLTLALNNATLAGGQGQEVANSALEQWYQIIAAGKPDLQSWRIINGAMPAQMNAIAEAVMGAGAKAQDLFEAWQKGTVTTKEVTDALMTLNKEGGDGVASFEEQVKGATGGIQTTISRMQSAIENGWVAIIEAIGQDTIINAIDALGKAIRAVMTVVGTVIGFVIQNKWIWPFLAGGLAVLVTIMWSVVAAMVSATMAQIGLNTAMLANPITWIIAAIVALIAAIVLLITHFDQVKEVARVVCEAIGNFFKGLWDGIVAIFNGVVGFFTSIFQGAWNAIKSIFGKVVDWFRGIFNGIVNVFKTVGTTIGNAVGGAFKAVVNGIIGFAEKFVNAPIKAINALIDVINAVPGISLGKLTELKLPRMAQGGLVTASTVANIGENGREAVLPLDRNTDNWSGLLASALADEFDARGGGGGGGITIEKQIFDISNEMDADDIGRKVMNSLRRAA